jgi:hypothetical protein
MSNRKRPKIGKSKVTVLDTGDAQKKHFGFAWGLYFWRLPDGHLFHDGEGNLLNIPSVEGDIGQMAKIREAAAAHGQPEGEAWFYAGVNRVSDEEYSEQIDRLNQGLIPSLNDIGAVAAAKNTLAVHGETDD